jgi:hypothetical protein
MNTTLVSCFYKIKSKHSVYKYITWIFYFLKKVKNPLIIFTNIKTKKILKEIININKNKNIILIIKEIEDLKIVKDYDLDFWEKQYKLDDPIKHGNRTKECYIIWNSKFNFLKEAIELNPFKTDNFIWNDIGSLRDNREINNYPNQLKISKNKLDIILLDSSINNFLNKEIYFKDSIFFSGAMFGGNKEIILKINLLYYNKFEDYVKNNKFIGCDQQIISSVYIQNQSLFNPILNNDWFYLYDYYN